MSFRLIDVLSVAFYLQKCERKMSTTKIVVRYSSHLSNPFMLLVFQFSSQISREKSLLKLSLELPMSVRLLIKIPVKSLTLSFFSSSLFQHRTLKWCVSLDAPIYCGRFANAINEKRCWKSDKFLFFPPFVECIQREGERKKNKKNGPFIWFEM